MLQFKLFEAKFNPYISTETQVNEWLKENPNVFNSYILYE